MNFPPLLSVVHFESLSVALFGWSYHCSLPREVIGIAVSPDMGWSGAVSVAGEWKTMKGMVATVLLALRCEYDDFPVVEDDVH